MGFRDRAVGAQRSAGLDRHRFGGAVLGLSGGIDSSLLVALLSEAGVKGLKKFSVGFEDQPEEKGNEFDLMNNSKFMSL